MVFRGSIIAASLSLGASITLDSRSRTFLTREGTSLTAEVSAEVHQELQGLAETLLSPDAVEGQASVHQSLRSIQGKMDVRAAAKAISHRKLPEDVASLVRTASAGGTGFSEESMDKARVALNDLVEKAWVELDDKIIECKEYQEMNRATFDQVTTDISRLVEQITDLERVETESLEGITKTDLAIQAVEAEISKETKIYNYNYAKNSEELTRRQNDLDVFQFILEFTQFDDSTSLLQSSANQSQSRICAVK
jgi:signal transduction histidine kinase